MKVDIRPMMIAMKLVTQRNGDDDTDDNSEAMNDHEDFKVKKCRRCIN